jgi:hypothetical protein
LGEFDITAHPVGALRNRIGNDGSGFLILVRKRSRFGNLATRINKSMGVVDSRHRFKDSSQFKRGPADRTSDIEGPALRGQAAQVDPFLYTANRKCQRLMRPRFPRELLIARPVMKQQVLTEKQVGLVTGVIHPAHPMGIRMFGKDGE